MIRHDDRQKFNLSYKIEKKGNWNKDLNVNPLFTKPLAYIKFTNRNNPSDEQTFIFSHNNILDIITAYYLADVESIEMIKRGEAGEIDRFETPFFEKIEKHLRLLKSIRRLN